MINPNKLPIELIFEIKKMKLVVKIIKIGFMITTFINDEELDSCMCGNMELWLGLSIIHKKYPNIPHKLIFDAEIGTIKKILKESENE
jgi:hypothetical protein